MLMINSNTAFGRSDLGHESSFLGLRNEPGHIEVREKKLISRFCINNRLNLQVQKELEDLTSELLHKILWQSDILDRKDRNACALFRIQRVRKCAWPTKMLIDWCVKRYQLN